MKKNINVNLYNRELTARISEFVSCRTAGKRISLVYGEQIAEKKAKIQGLTKSLGSCLDRNKTLEEIEAHTVDLEKLEAERKDAMDREARFSLTKADRAFTKAVKGLSVDDPAIALAVKGWFEVYGLNVTSSKLLAKILRGIGAKEDWTRFADTNGEDGLSVDQTRALRVLYWTTFTEAVKQGSVKAEHVPSIIWDRYSTISREARAAEKKAAKAAEKKASEPETKAA